MFSDLDFSLKYRGRFVLLPICLTYTYQDFQELVKAEKAVSIHPLPRRTNVWDKRFLSERCGFRVFLVLRDLFLRKTSVSIIFKPILVYASLNIFLNFLEHFLKQRVWRHERNIRGFRARIWRPTPSSRTGTTACPPSPLWGVYAKPFSSPEANPIKYN